MLYRARTEFHVASRIPWTGREAELRRHLDDVVLRLEEHPAIGDIVVDADPERAWVTIELIVHRPRGEPDPEHDVRVMLSDAIVNAGAPHEGLLPLGEESRVRPRQNAWWGLRTPRWSTRAFHMEVTAET
jgi:hypothetical protein